MNALRPFAEADVECRMSREWAMPNRWTFTIPPIARLIGRYLNDGNWLNPFAGLHVIGTLTNDLNPAMPTTHHLDALDFLRAQPSASADGVLFDPPYSPGQIVEVYRSFGLAVTKETTQAAFWARCKDEIGRVTRPGATVISCGWNSGGIGIDRGFDITEILLVAHGGWHNDTIVTVERKRGAW
ncbi:MAG TPA: hypothetical protein VMH41_16895 [Mycobacteriales bacterium]|nr:hypothetical protein [Mycobacteriales bacterium]